MAQNATIHKVELSVSDMDRHYYETHKLTVAKHPSETDQRLMVRIFAFALNASEHLEMTKGLSADDEPDIWQKSLSGELNVWVTLGLPSEKVIRQSCNKADKVVIYPYGGRTANLWWTKIKHAAARFDNLQVINLSEKDTNELAKLADRAMKLQVNIQDGDVMVSMAETIVHITPLIRKRAA
ncbi:YaeQ family protein [Paracoccus liaowanqingii]|uniref:YaeQ family protein n=1 Tax=Paracoccus liaowanqingii TaxID=2560053 RepID=A0A4P7HLJ2_9RHOB|nr:YaeQ family protein [Paracoccus liaowanqingii]QBX35098.1 YaeQ family protein [Paracoccus liaowanqingii]